jgi:hypothetical protein
MSKAVPHVLFVPVTHPTIQRQLGLPVPQTSIIIIIIIIINHPCDFTKLSCLNPSLISNFFLSSSSSDRTRLVLHRHHPAQSPIQAWLR